MDQILSQEEIDALLKGISEGEIETEKESEEKKEQKGEIKPFEFFTRVKTKKERLPALDFVYDRFSKSLRGSLSLFLEKEIEVELSSKEYLEYEEFIKTLPLPTNMNIITTEGVKGFFILIFDAKLIFSILEVVFGSVSVGTSKVEGREFTRIEMSIIRKVIDLILGELEKAWAPVHEIQCKYSRSEMNPNYVTMISPEETVHLTTFSVEIDEMKGWFKICVPYGILDTIKEYLISTPAREEIEMRQKWFQLLKKNIMEVPLEVKAVLGRKRLHLNDFLNLKTKDVFLLDNHVDDPIEIFVENKPLLNGRIGTFKGNMAVRIERRIL